MERKSIKSRIALFLLTTAVFILMSPKWLFAPAAWIAPFLLIALVSDLKPWKSYVISVMALACSSIISQHKVMPFPGVFFPIMILVVSVQSAVPYFINRIFYPMLLGWKKTLVFPTAVVGYEYLISFGGGGTWSSMAYSQTSNTILMQSASLGGIWIVTFFLAWFGSSLFWIHENGWRWKEISMPVLLFAVLLLCIALYGLIRTNPYFESRQMTVRVAGISSNNIPALKTMYENAYGNGLKINEDELTQTSPELAELNRGFVQFIENPLDKKFLPTRQKFIELQDNLFVISRREAIAGSKIISWSEAAAFTLKSEEDVLFAKGEKFARENKAYFLMTVASIIPGKIEIGKKFIENKALLFDPSGKILNVFFKNRPVPMVEPSIPGDGIVPVVATPYGRLAVSICYDADFPPLMRQLAAKDADILLLPSGDWREISPYHANMASVRAIENGVSLMRPVSGARSIATNYCGNIIGWRDYVTSGDKVVVAYLPIKGVNTLYTIIGDSFAWICIVTLVGLAMMAVLGKVRGDGRTV